MCGRVDSGDGGWCAGCFAGVIRGGEYHNKDNTSHELRQRKEGAGGDGGGRRTEGANEGGEWGGASGGVGWREGRREGVVYHSGFPAPAPELSLYISVE